MIAAPPPSPESELPGASPVNRVPRRRRGRWTFLLILVILVILVSGGVALWSWGALRYTYASGQHTGYLRTLAKTGWICKTWEGALVTDSTPASPPRLFAFTIRNDSLAQVIQNAPGKRLTLTYAQHLPFPSRCFGETRYFIEGVRVLP